MGLPDLLHDEFAKGYKYADTYLIGINAQPAAGSILGIADPIAYHHPSRQFLASVTKIDDGGLPVSFLGKEISIPVGVELDGEYQVVSQTLEGYAPEELFHVQQRDPQMALWIPPGREVLSFPEACGFYAMEDLMALLKSQSQQRNGFTTGIVGWQPEMHRKDIRVGFAKFSDLLTLLNSWYEMVCPILDSALANYVRGEAPAEEAARLQEYQQKLALSGGRRSPSATLRLLLTLDPATRDDRLIEKMWDRYATTEKTHGPFDIADIRESMERLRKQLLSK